MSLPDLRCDAVPDLLQHWICLASSHLAHFALAVSREERHVVDLIHHHKVLLLSLEVLQKTGRKKKYVDACSRECELLLCGLINALTWDLDQKMKTSPTIRNSSSASGSGHVSHLALHQTK